jgi:hypothetical protein
MKLDRKGLELAKRVKKEYRLLKGLSPKEACERIAKGWEKTAEEIRVMVSYKAVHRICAKCWGKCKNCYICHDCRCAYRRANWKIHNDTPTRKFYTPDELKAYARRTLHMSEAQFGEALSDIRVNRIYERRHTT